MPLYHLNFADYGLNMLSPSAIKAAYAQLQKTSFENIEAFLSNKEGFNATNPNLFKQGKDLLAGWGLINISTRSAHHFFCQASQAYSSTTLNACLKKTKSEAETFLA